MKYLIEIDRARYELEKLDPGWQLWKYKESAPITKGRYAGRDSKAGFKPMGLYPSDIYSALNMIAMDMMGDNTNKAELLTALKDIRDAMGDLPDANILL